MKLSNVVAVIVGSVLSLGCGLDVTVMTRPNPSVVGHLTEIKIDVVNDDESCVIDDVEVCVFPFSQLTPEQVRAADAFAAAKESGNAIELVGTATAGIDLVGTSEIAMASLGEAVLPNECSQDTPEEPICCDLGTLVPDQEKTLLIFVTPTVVGEFANLVFATGSANPNVDCLDTTFGDADIEEVVVGTGIMAPALSPIGLALLIGVLGLLAITAIRRRGLG